jgi:hypothetical protein
VNRAAMAARTWTSLATPDVKRALQQLLEPSQTTYRAAMKDLGRHLGDHLKSQLGRGKFAVVTTPEDADYLTTGLLERVPSERALLACFWTQRLEKADVASVVQEFIQPLPRSLPSVVIVKSIISSGCIVRTNLEKFLTLARPERIFIAAPVMLKGADETLRGEFSPEIARRFEFVTFAIDARRDGRTKAVVPGVGGWVDERLGLKDKSPRFAPALVRERLQGVAALT